MSKARPSVTQLNNDYVKSKSVDEKRHKKFKLVMRRRLLFYLAIILLVVGTLVFNVVKQQMRLTTNKAESIKLEKKYEQLVKQEATYKQQVEQLKDPEYVAKLARSEYYLSKKGEIIFTIPSKED
ncbi:FtsB family cell division protein [Brochothrix campestris]|uniref:Cell division protein n=1 Tax=Brochothrix campestris FSL F6-1037 TaxID=1265861 RepID=W7CUG3_9LIST|nr:cell division protein [Brochothrix campestris FSL F6-1037]